MTDAVENFDVDATMDVIAENAQPTERPMSAPPAAAPATPTVQEFEIPYNGKNIKAPLDKVTKWASQGYDYSQKMNEFNLRMKEFENQRQALSPFQEVDAFARANPQWWEHVRSAYQQAQQQGQGQQQTTQAGVPEELLGALNPLKSELSEIKSWKETVERERIAYQHQQEDKALESEINSIREKYGDLDFDRVDEEGHTLEAKVLKHAVDNGIKSFRTAFNDYMSDELVKRAESRGREAAVRERQEHAKRGLLGRTQAPTKGLTPAQNHKNKSYQDLTREALDELGIS